MLVLVEPNVVGVGVGVLLLGHVAQRLDDAVEVGLEARPVVRGFGAAPDVVGLHGESAECRLLLGRDVDEGGAVAFKDVDLRDLGLAKKLRLGPETLKQGADLGGAERADTLLLEDGARLAALLGGARRGDHGTKGADLIDGVAKGKELALERVERGDVGARVRDSGVEVCGCRVNCHRFLL